MRISTTQQKKICNIIYQLLSDDVDIRVFGSRLDDNAKGGDLDLFIQTPHIVEHPAAISAKIAAQVYRVMHGRKVDVLLQAPNLKITPIHHIARQKGESIK